jgi:putative PEP-CTERM system histidine kinase
VLLFPLGLGGRLLGLIGLGPEFTGGEYGHDDFDLLTALGSQAASALLAARMAEELAHVREQQAWNRLSAFVLHDIKNAATMLSLLRENAPDHIHEPEFQQDMLEVVDDALRRMGRVEERLQTLKNEVMPERRELELGDFLKKCCRRLQTQLPAMEMKVEVQDGLWLESDPELLFSIFENLMLNAFEAGGEGTSARIRAWKAEEDGQVVVEVIDNGPGIPAELLPEALFEPFKTSKAGGSGIGLWQVRRMLESLGGSITAENMEAGGGARFVVRLPLVAGIDG